jgi:hypothetical protein
MVPYRLILEETPPLRTRLEIAEKLRDSVLAPPSQAPPRGTERNAFSGITSVTRNPISTKPSAPKTQDPVGWIGLTALLQKVEPPRRAFDVLRPNLLEMRFTDRLENVPVEILVEFFAAPRQTPEH